MYLELLNTFLHCRVQLLRVSNGEYCSYTKWCGGWKRCTESLAEEFAVVHSCLQQTVSKATGHGCFHSSLLYILYTHVNAEKLPKQFHCEDNPRPEFFNLYSGYHRGYIGFSIAPFTYYNIWLAWILISNFQKFTIRIFTEIAMIFFQQNVIIILKLDYFSKWNHWIYPLIWLYFLIINII